MQYVTIKQEEKDGQEVFAVNAIPLKNSNKSVVQRIPHPLGTDVLRFNSLEEAKDAIVRAGFSYILPNGEKGTKSAVKMSVTPGMDYSQLVFETVKDKTNSSNTNVAASALLAISVFKNEEAFDILFNKIGEDNDLIRKNAVAGICAHAALLSERIIDSLKSSNWVERNSALSCIANIAENGNVDLEKFIVPLTEVCNDSNTIVQANALATLANVYKNYLKTRK
ncbi:MAG: hypothetical protein NC191_08365 [Muribaculaceae bacterium]|nr:hypothetical protein [Muribaculaceae bacterium]